MKKNIQDEIFNWKVISLEKPSVLNPEGYCVQTFLHTERLLPLIHNISKHASSLQDIDIAQEDRIRRYGIMWPDTMALFMARIARAIVTKSPFSLGSQYKSHVAWANIGTSLGIAKHHFENFRNIYDHYKHYTEGENLFQAKSYYGQRKDIIQNKITTRFKKDCFLSSHNLWINLSICLMNDVIIHCDFDCPEVREIFCNSKKTKTRLPSVRTVSTIPFSIYTKPVEQTKFKTKISFKELPSETIFANGILIKKEVREVKFKDGMFTIDNYIRYKEDLIDLPIRLDTLDNIMLGNRRRFNHRPNILPR